nr:zinc finger, CCHC-type [Tanacetum cinerariifolium]
MTTLVGNNSVFRSFFEKQKVIGPNFIDWYRQLRLVLLTENKENYLEHPIPAAPVAPPGQQVPPQALATHVAWVKGQKEDVVLMLLTMYLEIQRNLAHLGAYDMLQELKAMYSKQAKQELLQTNYNMHGMGKTVNELHAMLKLHEETLPKKDAYPVLHAIRAGRVQKNQKNKPHKAAKGGHVKGYPKETMGYSFYSPSKNKVFVAQNAEFCESKLLDLKASGSVENLELIQDEDTNHSIHTSLNHEEDDQEVDEPQSDINPIRKSSRTRRTPDRMCVYIDPEKHELEDLGEPANYKAALLDPKSKKWLDAMNVKMQSIKDNDGFTQTYGVDYEETFSPVADIRAIRLLIAIAAYYDYEIWQMDVKTTFLNGHLSEEVYIEQHEGSIMYAVRCTRPDVAFAQNMTSRFQQNLGEEHWTAVKNILKYLCNTKDMFLTGYVFILNGGAVDWKSTKQSIFATSSTDAEYIATFDASKEAVWIRKFISGLGIVPTIKEPISMYCDNTGAIAIAKDDGVTKGARHFCAKVRYLRKTIKLGDVKIEKIDTYDNLADPFTKALAFSKHSELTRNIGLLPASSFM